jgi:methylenetetrahydrofolate reductase (NADPH)
MTENKQRDYLEQLMSDFSIEIHPRIASKIDSFQAYLHHRTRVFITFIPGSHYSEVVQAADKLSKNDMRPVPHISARSLHSKQSLDDYIKQLQNVGVDEVLVISGDMDKPAGPFESVFPILESGKLEQAGIKTINVSGHPEGNSKIGEKALNKAIKRKNELAKQSSADYQMVTQFAFKAKPIIQWEKRIRPFNELPICIGLAGPAKLKNLIHFAKISGIGSSIRALTGNPLNYFRLATTSTPAPIMTELAQSIEQDPDSLIKSFHFYSFGGFKRTASWLEAVKNGRFYINKVKSGFTVMNNS